MPKEASLEVLPFSHNLKNPKWSYFNAYNLRTIRDIFVLCYRIGKISNTEIDEIITENILPPKDRWINPNVKRKERHVLEYKHAAEYLGLIKKENGLITADMADFANEKLIIIEENERITDNGKFAESPPFTVKEKEAFLTIILNYERARDFLRWFLDFNKYPYIWSFTLEDFKRDAAPIFLSKSDKNEKGSSILKREIDKKIWLIPTEKPDDYRRLASTVFPKWFQELGLINMVNVFPEFDESGHFWHMYYPIKMCEEELLKQKIKDKIYEVFFKDDSQKYVHIWIPHLLYVLSHEYRCPLETIMYSIEKLYKEDFTHFYLDRSSKQAMRGTSVLQKQYIKVDGFYRSHLKVLKE